MAAKDSASVSRFAKLFHPLGEGGRGMWWCGWCGWCGWCLFFFGGELRNIGGITCIIIYNYIFNYIYIYIHPTCKWLGGGFICFFKLRKKGGSDQAMTCAYFPNRMAITHHGRVERTSNPVILKTDANLQRETCNHVICLWTWSSDGTVKQPRLLSVVYQPVMIRFAKPKLFSGMWFPGVFSLHEISAGWSFCPVAKPW